MSRDAIAQVKEFQVKARPVIPEDDNPSVLADHMTALMDCLSSCDMEEMNSENVRVLTLFGYNMAGRLRDVLRNR